MSAHFNDDARIQPSAEEDVAFVSTKGSALNYVLWNASAEVFCEDRNNPSLWKLQEGAPSLGDYVAAFNKASTPEEKVKCAAEFKGLRWTVHVPQIVVGNGSMRLTVGDVEGGMWTYKPKEGVHAGVKIACPDARMGAPIPLSVRAVSSLEEFEKSGGSGLIVDRVGTI
ncbi:MAG: hypothetical protein JJ902_05905 [Roseibium sp.]|nr:hypothetical protein [Roseibium sp.]